MYIIYLTLKWYLESRSMIIYSWLFLLYCSMPARCLMKCWSRANLYSPSSCCASLHLFNYCTNQTCSIRFLFMKFTPLFHYKVNWVVLPLVISCYMLYTYRSSDFECFKRNVRIIYPIIKHISAHIFKILRVEKKVKLVIQKQIHYCILWMTRNFKSALI
jgi:hypothetical protein